MTAEETALGGALSKLALNVCLLATACGVRCLGPANPSYHERLKRYARLSRKRGRERQEKAEADLRTAPVRYAFAQGVRLYQREEAAEHSEGSSGAGGWTVSPLGGGATGAGSRAGRGGRSGGGWPSPRCW
jgi:hypothetical protein